MLRVDFMFPQLSFNKAGFTMDAVVKQHLARVAPTGRWSFKDQAAPRQSRPNRALVF